MPAAQAAHGAMEAPAADSGQGRSGGFTPPWRDQLAATAAGWQPQSVLS